MANEAVSGTIVGVADVVDVTLSLDTGIYADNDVLAAPQEVVGFFRMAEHPVLLQSLKLQDDSDQGQDVEILFMNASGSIGNENAAFAPADGVAGTIIGRVIVAAADYSDAANSQFAMKSDIGQILKGAADTRSVWIAAVCRSGTPTYAADGIKLKLGVVRF